MELSKHIQSEREKAQEVAMLKERLRKMLQQRGELESVRVMLEKMRMANDEDSSSNGGLSDQESDEEEARGLGSSATAGVSRSSSSPHGASEAASPNQSPVSNSVKDANQRSSNYESGSSSGVKGSPVKSIGGSSHTNPSVASATFGLPEEVLTQMITPPSPSPSKSKISQD
jgi:hypothetical protein